MLVYFEVTLRQNMTEELSLNDDPDSLMIEETSTLGLPNISDITRFKIDFELPAGKIHIFQNSQVVPRVRVGTPGKVRAASSGHTLEAQQINKEEKNNKKL